MKKKVKSNRWYRLKYNLEYKAIILVLITLASTFILINYGGSSDSLITGAVVGYSLQTRFVGNLTTGDLNVSVYLFNDTDTSLDDRLWNDTDDANDVDATDDYGNGGTDVFFFPDGVTSDLDTVYMGSDTTFTAAYFNVTAGSSIGNHAADFWDWFYYNGTDWENLTTVINLTNAFVSVGVHIVNWTEPSNWANATITNISGEEYGPYYFVRFICPGEIERPCGGATISQISLEAASSGAAPDTTIPSVSAINSPTNGATYSLGNTIVFNASVSDDTGIASVLFQISNGSNPGNLTGSSTNTSLYNASLTVSSASIIDGTHTLTVFASDAAGNLNDTETLTFIVDSTPPTISSSSSSSVSTTSATLSATTNEAATCKYSTTDQAYASMTDTMGGGGGTSHSVALASLSSGRAYVYYIRCQDTPGNPQTSSTQISFTTTSSGGGGGGGGGSSSSTSTTTAITTTTSTTTSTTTTTAPATTTETQQYVQNNLVTVDITTVSPKTVTTIVSEDAAVVGAATTSTAGLTPGETATAEAAAVQTESINPEESVVISITNNADKVILLQPFIVSDVAGTSIINEDEVDAFLQAKISEENKGLSEAELSVLVEQEKRLFELIEKVNVQPVYTKKISTLIGQLSNQDLVEVVASANLPVPIANVGEEVNVMVDSEEFAVEEVSFVVPGVDEKGLVYSANQNVERAAMVQEVSFDNSPEQISATSNLADIPAVDQVGIVAIESLANLPVAKSFQGVQYKQLDINVDVARAAVIKFMVPEEWVNDVGLSNEDIGMYHYNELTGLWEELPAEIVGVSDGFVHLEAQALGFSYFIIGEKGPQLIENKLNKAVRRILNEGEIAQKQTLVLSGLTYTGEKISGKLLQSSLGTCGEIRVKPGETFESTCKLKRGIASQSDSFKITFTSQGKEVFQKDVGPKQGVIGTALDVDQKQGLLEFYMLIPERVDEIKDGEEEFDNYYLEISLDKDDVNLGESVIYSDYFGPYKIRRDEGFVFAQQLAYDSQRYVGEYNIRTKVLNKNRVVAEHLFVENLGEEGTLPRRLSDGAFNEVASVIAVVLPLLSLLSFMFIARRKVH
ncbi:MAG: PGF-pre-PGF domain-containing protein [archaeon]|nr:PGF-pre-PGF domain-containing protein [archaeon]